MKNLLYAAILLDLTILSAAVGVAQDTQSAALASKLTDLLDQQQLNAIATRDTEEPDRFTAALYFPGSQLLVVSAQYPTPLHVQALLERKAYEDVYQELQSGSTMSSRLFFHDLNADGLRADDREAVDILYERGTTRTIFGGDSKNQHLTEKAYKDKLVEAEARYARLLGQLVAALGKSR